jgi:hypothetical protein
MNPILRFALVAFFSSALCIGGAPAAQAQDESADAASSLSPAITGVVGTPEPGKALVVFYRKKAFRGAGVRYKVRENDVELGKLSSGTWFALQVEPGPHTYVVHSEARDVTTIEFEAGETYFIAGTVTFGVFAGRPNLTPSNAEEFEAELAKLKPAKPL